MFLATCFCTFKCPIELGLDPLICQNEPIYHQPNIEVATDEIFRRYHRNPITHAVVFGGLEPFLQFDEMLEVIKTFRNNGCNDTMVIYTGYYESEISHQIELLSQYCNIYLKVGRYKPGQQPHYDPVLGILLANSEQYGKRIS